MTQEYGHQVIKISGPNVWEHFKNEPGKHVCCRIPITERNGRKQTSLVTVAVVPLPPENIQEPLKEQDLDIKFQCASGPGGQHQNKTASACRMKHKPTGLEVFITGRDQHANRREARHILTTKVNNFLNEQKMANYNGQRKTQMTSHTSVIGSRGQKVRTWNFFDSRITDHVLNVKTNNIKEMLKGNFSVLFGK